MAGLTFAKARTVLNAALAATACAVIGAPDLALGDAAQPSATVGAVPDAIYPDRAPFNAKGDCKSDDTAAIQSAIAAAQAISTSSGAIPVVQLNKPCYAVNLILTGKNLIVRHGATATNRAVASKLAPFDKTRPVIQIGDGTTPTAGMALDNISLQGDGTGEVGLFIQGASALHFNNFTAMNFTKSGVSITDSKTQPATLLWFDGFEIEPANVAGAVGAKVVHSAGGFYTTAVYFANGHFESSGKLHSELLHNESDDLSDAANISVSNSYFDCGSAAPGVAACYVVAGAANSPTFSGSNVTFDGGNPAGLTIDISGVPGVGGQSLPAQLQGSVTVNGLVKTNQGVSSGPVQNGYWLPYQTVLLWPQVERCITFNDGAAAQHTQYSNSAATNHKICRSGPSLSLYSNVSQGGINLYTDAAGGRFARFLNLAGGLGGIQLGGSGAPELIAGTAANPNSTIFGDPGALYHNNAGGAGASLWTKESGAHTRSGWVKVQTVESTTVAGLPSSPAAGQRALVTDAKTCAFNVTVSGGGTAACPVVYNGSTWVAG